MPKTEEILVPDLGDFDKVEVTEVLVEVDQNITSNENSSLLRRIKLQLTSRQIKQERYTQ